MIDDAAANGATISGTLRSPAAAVTDWDARPGLGEPWLWKKVEFKDRIEQGSNNIFEATKRGVASWIHCGNDVARVIRQLTDSGFKPRAGWTGAAPTGPMVIGDLDGRPVVQNPFKAKNYYTLGFRGPSYLYAGFIYCPYIPSERRHCQVTDNENSVNCGNIRRISNYQLRKAA